MLLFSSNLSSAAVVIENGLLNISGSIVGDNLGLGGSLFNIPGGISGRGIAFPSTRNDALRIYGEHDNNDRSNIIIEQRDNSDDGVIFRNIDWNPAVGSSDYMRIARDGLYYVGGKAGIGTKNPTTMLQIGQAGTRNHPNVNTNSFSLAYGSDYFYIIPTTVSGDRTKLLVGIGDDSDDMISFGSFTSGDTLTLHGNGYVGVGTASPNEKFTVAGNIGAGGSSFANRGGVSGQGISFPSSTNDALRIYGEHDNVDNSNLVIEVKDNYNDGVLFRIGNINPPYNNLDFMKISKEKMYFLGDKAGIGTKDPTALFEVDDNVTDSWSDNPVLSLRTRGSGGNGGPAMDFRYNWQGGPTYNMGRISSITAEGYSGQMIFYTASNNGNPDNSLAERMRINQNGFVGIGTKNPQSNLQVKGYAQIDSSISIPVSADCDSDAERGRLILEYTNNRMYICNGASRGWDYLVLNN